MSQMPPPPPSAMGEPMPPTYGASEQRGWSGLAIVGFILACLGCTAPIGLILGIVALFTTGAGRKKGKVLAILAIPASLVTGGCLGVIGYGTVKVTRQFVELMEDLPTIVQDAPSNPDEAIDLLSPYLAAELDSVLTAEAISDWATRVADEHGTLRSIDMQQQGAVSRQILPDGTVILNLPGKFVKGSANLRVTFKSGGFDIRISDLAVGDISLLEIAGGGEPRGGDDIAPGDGDDEAGVDEADEAGGQDDGSEP